MACWKYAAVPQVLQVLLVVVVPLVVLVLMRSRPLLQRGTHRRLLDDGQLPAPHKLGHCRDLVFH